MTDVDRAIEILRFNGHNVWRMDFPAPPWPGLYRINGGPELTEAQLVHAAESMPPTVLASDGIAVFGGGHND